MTSCDLPGQAYVRQGDGSDETLWYWTRPSLAIGCISLSVGLNIILLLRLVAPGVAVVQAPQVENLAVFAPGRVNKGIVQPVVGQWPRLSARHYQEGWPYRAQQLERPLRHMHQAAALPDDGRKHTGSSQELFGLELAAAERALAFDVEPQIRKLRLWLAKAAAEVAAAERRTVLSARYKPSSSGEEVAAPAGGSYKDSGAFAKAIVGGLTAVVNAVFTPRAEDAAALEARRRDREQAPPLPPEAIVAGLRTDFSERGYLFTGEISDELYDDDCVFTDPTISFRGLDTFRRNLASLQPILNTFLSDDRQVIVRSGPTLLADENKVRAEWTMSGGLKILPWKPRIELDGATTFTFSPDRKGRIVSYDETWEISAMEALGQLVRTGEPRDGER